MVWCEKVFSWWRCCGIMRGGMILTLIVVLTGGDSDVGR